MFHFSSRRVAIVASFVLLAGGTLYAVAPAHAQTIINNGTFTGLVGANGADGANGVTGNTGSNGADGTPANNYVGGDGGTGGFGLGTGNGGNGLVGENGYTFLSGTLTITGGTFTGGRGGNGGDGGDGGQGGTGGRGGDTTVLAVGGRGGNGGTGGFGGIGGNSGGGGNGLFVSGASTVVNIYGGSFTGGTFGTRGFAGLAGSGGFGGRGGSNTNSGQKNSDGSRGSSGTPGSTGFLGVAGKGIVAAGGAQVFVFADDGTFTFTNGFARGKFNGVSFSIPASVSGTGSSIQAGVIVVPEANTATLLALALPIIGAVVVVRRRKK